MIPKSINILRRLLEKVAARQVTVQLVSPHVFEALDKRHACLKDMQGPTSIDLANKLQNSTRSWAAKLPNRQRKDY